MPTFNNTALTECAEAMLTFNKTTLTVACFFFNHIISRFCMPKQLVSDHDKNFKNEISEEFSSLLKLRHEFMTPYYPQFNGQVEAINKIVKTILQRTIDKNRSNWQNHLYLTLWAYQTTIKMTTDFNPFHLVHGVEVFLPIECEIPTLHTVINLLLEPTASEQHLHLLKRLDKDRRATLQQNQAMKRHSKTAYDRHVYPRTFYEGDLVLSYDLVK